MRSYMEKGMKTRRLPEIDLARIMHRPRSEMRLLLQNIGQGHPPHSYQPLRETIPDIFNEKGSLIGIGPVSWEIVKREISSKVRRGPEEERHNLTVGQLLHQHALENGICSRRHEFFPLKIVKAGGVRYWWDMYYIEGGRVVVPFVDPRLSRGLAASDRRVVFSFMHERIRVPGSDFEDARLAIFQFPKDPSGNRFVRVHYDDGISLFNYYELSDMVAALYEEWDAELAEREREARSATPRTGGMFG
jgi:hypothetical protein